MVGIADGNIIEPNMRRMMIVPSTVFDDFTRTQQDPSPLAVSHFEHLDKSARAAEARIRALINGWFAATPASPEARADLRSRLRSDKEAEFFGAFWELYLHENFRSLGFSIKPHPTVSETSARPDFLIASPQGEMYVEAKYVVESTDEAPGEEERRDTVYDAINTRLVSPSFCLWVDTHRVGPRSLSVTNLVRSLSTWLRTLDHASALASFRGGRWDRKECFPCYRWSEDDWNFSFYAMPKTQSDDGRTARPLGVLGTKAVWCKGREDIYKALCKKGGKYGELDKPYVIAVMSTGDFIDSKDVIAALFGEEEVVIGFDLNGDVASQCNQRKRNGFWVAERRPEYTRVSAVMTALGVFPWSITSAAPFVVENPWATRKLPTGMLPWRTMFPNHEQNTLVELAATKLPHEILGLAKAWPGE